MMETQLPLPAELRATLVAPEPAPPAEQLAALRLENATAPRKRPMVPSGRKRGGQPGHRGAFRRLLPVETVEEIAVVVPERCRHCSQAFPELAGRRHGAALEALLGSDIMGVVGSDIRDASCHRCPLLTSARIHHVESR